MSEISTLAVIGAGQMGGGITQIAAVAGLNAVVFDANASQLDRCKATHEKLLTRAVDKGRMEQAAADEALGRITYAGDFSTISKADWVVEAVVENADVKKKIFSDLAHMFQQRGDVALCSNTSSISITTIELTSGGNAWRTRTIEKPSTTSTSEATRKAPKTTASPCSRPIPTIAPRNAIEVPMTIGTRAPTGPMG